MFASILAVIGNYFVLYSPFGLPNFGVTGLAFSSVFGNTIGLIVAAFLLKNTLVFCSFCPIEVFIMGRNEKCLNLWPTFLRRIFVLSRSTSGSNDDRCAIGSSVLIAKSYVTAITQFVYLIASALSQGKSNHDWSSCRRRRI